MRRLLGSDQRRHALLIALMATYGVASLLHFVHNAVYLEDYPNIPQWLTAFGVYASWVSITLVGVAGYGIYRVYSPRFGLMTIAVYALLGFGGLDHYVVAPMSAHTVAMNATILFEVATAAALLGLVYRCWRRDSGARRFG